MRLQYSLLANILGQLCALKRRDRRVDGTHSVEDDVPVLGPNLGRSRCGFGLTPWGRRRIGCGQSLLARINGR